MTRVWCAIPVYNNAGTIADIARRCREQIENVLVIDDGSTDADLRDVLKSLDVIVIRHPANLGKGAAILTALHHANEHGAEYLITLDGDAQHYPEDIPKFLPRLDPATILIGSRDEVIGEMPGASVFGREFSDFWICTESGCEARDTQSGFRTYPIRKSLELKLSSRHYNLEMEIVTRAVWAGMEIGNVPVRVWYPEPSQRVSSFDPLRDNLRISLLHFRLVLLQLLPVPHRSGCRHFQRWLLVNSSPLGLAVAAAIAIVPGVVLWPWGFVLVFYVAQRLHLNKIAVLASVAICMLPIVPQLCRGMGRLVVAAGHPHLEWFFGAHIIAFAAAAIVSGTVFAIARWMRK